MEKIRALFKKYFAIGVIVGVCVAVVFVSLLPQIALKQAAVPGTSSPTITDSSINQTLTYRGEEGKDAMTLLKEKAQVEQEPSGLVSSINGRKADDSKREYWAFYVNNKLASVGPSEYQTKDTDMILWKIETY